MKKKNLTFAIILGVCSILIILSVLIFILTFWRTSLSCSISDWGDFGSYINGVITPILSTLNIYIFYMISKAATNYERANVIQQLKYGTCKEYQNKINEIIFQLLECIAQYNEKRDIIILNRAKTRLSWLQYYIDSFIVEAKPLLSISKELNDRVLKLKQAIESLQEKELSDENAMREFIEAKSQFIEIVFNEMIN